MSLEFPALLEPSGRTPRGSRTFREGPPPPTGVLEQASGRNPATGRGDTLKTGHTSHSTTIISIFILMTVRRFPTRRKWRNWWGFVCVFSFFFFSRKLATKYSVKTIASRSPILLCIEHAFSGASRVRPQPQESLQKPWQVPLLEKRKKKMEKGVDNPASRAPL